MLETSARLLRLLAVLQARRFWAGSELARHLEVTPRTLRRDVDRLRGLGYAVEATSGPGGGYQLGKGRQMPPLMLEDEEAVALAVAVRAALDAFSGVEDAAMRALVKLEQLMPAGLRKRVGAFSSATLSLGRARVAVSADLLVVLAGACRDERKLSFEYTGHDRVGSTREVEPLRLVHSGHGPWYLVAWDLAREDWRTFRADRIQGAPRVGERFVPRPPPDDLGRYVSHAISTAPYAWTARVRLAGDPAALAGRVPSWCGVVSPDGVLTTGANSVEALVAQLVHVNLDFELMEAPEEVRAHLALVAGRLAPAAGIKARAAGRRAGPRTPRRR